MEWAFDERLPKDTVILYNTSPADAYVAFFTTWVHVNYPSRCIQIEGITAGVDEDLEMDIGL